METPKVLQNTDEKFLTVLCWDDESRWQEEHDYFYPPEDYDPEDPEDQPPAFHELEVMTNEVEGMGGSSAVTCKLVVKHKPTNTYWANGYLYYPGPGDYRYGFNKGADRWQQVFPFEKTVTAFSLQEASTHEVNESDLCALQANLVKAEEKRARKAAAREAKAKK